MLIQPGLLRAFWNLHPERVVHVGAHLGEEAGLYKEVSFGQFSTIWIEANPQLINRLKAAVFSQGVKKTRVICAAIRERSGIPVSLKVTNNGESSSLLDLHLHSEMYPQIFEVDRIDLSSSALQDLLSPNDIVDAFLNIDIQGLELEALKSLGDLITLPSAIYSEVNFLELYKGCSLASEIHGFLESKGFTLCDFELLVEGWGDALWIRNDLVPKYPKARASLRRFFSRGYRRHELPLSIATIFGGPNHARFG